MKAKLLRLFLILFMDVFSLVTASASDRKFLLNNEIDPCQNFYQHVCSNEIESFVRPPHRSQYPFQFADAFESLLPKINSFIEQLSTKQILSSRAEQIRTFYGSCMDKSARVDEEKALSERIIKEVQPIKTRNEFLTYAARLTKFMDLTWIEVENAPLLEDPKKWRIVVFADWTSLPEKSYYQNKETLKDLTSIITDLLKALKVEEASEKANRIIELETAIASSVPTPEEAENFWNIEKYWSRNEFVKRYPTLSELIDAKSFPQGIPFHQYTVKYYDSIEKTLVEADLETLKAFLLVRLMLPKLDFSQPEWNARYRKFKNMRMGGPAERRPLDRECVQLVRAKLGLSLAAEMTKQFFSHFPRTEFTAFVESLRSTLIQEIKENQWISPQGRKAALKKIKSLRMALLYPEKEEDWRFIPFVKLQSKQFLENLKLINQAYGTRTLSEIKAPRNVDAWTISPLAFDPYYKWSENRFYFPAAFALGPIFDSEKGKIENLGGIGTVIGHELGHALDKYGSQYNENGVKRSIFSKQDQKEFERLSHSFIEQFNKIGHNGEQTVAENLADHVGLLTAFRTAFPKGKDLKQQKSFFISYARSWCTSMSEEYRISHLKENVHSLPEARVNEQLKHLPAFAETFHCSANSKMVLPEDQRLRIW